LCGHLTFLAFTICVYPALFTTYNQGIVLDRSRDDTPRICDLEEGTVEVYWPLDSPMVALSIRLESARSLYRRGSINASQFVTIVIRSSQIFLDNDELCIDCRFACCKTLLEQLPPIIFLGYHRWSGTPLIVPESVN